MTIVYYACRTSHFPTNDSRNGEDMVESNSTSFWDLPNLSTIDLYSDEYNDEGDIEDDVLYKTRRTGRWGALWKFYDFIV